MVGETGEGADGAGIWGALDAETKDGKRRRMAGKGPTSPVQTLSL